MSAEKRQAISEAVRTAFQKKKETFSITITVTPKEVTDHINNNWGTEFTIEDIKRNWEGIRAWMQSNFYLCLTEDMWTDFEMCAPEWKVDLFD